VVVCVGCGGKIAFTVLLANPLITGNPLIPRPFLYKIKGGTTMAFYNKTDDLPRDPSAIEASANGGVGFLATVIVLLIVAAAFGLYFLYADGGSTQRTITEPSTTQLSPAPAPTPAPATQPPTQTPTP
jgi:hypothetical protein